MKGTSLFSKEKIKSTIHYLNHAYANIHSVNYQNMLSSFFLFLILTVVFLSFWFTDFILLLRIFIFQKELFYVVFSVKYFSDWNKAWFNGNNNTLSVKLVHYNIAIHPSPFFVEKLIVVFVNNEIHLFLLGINEKR